MSEDSNQSRLAAHGNFAFYEFTKLNPRSSMLLVDMMDRTDVNRFSPNDLLNHFLPRLSSISSGKLPSRSIQNGGYS